MPAIILPVIANAILCLSTFLAVHRDQRLDPVEQLYHLMNLEFSELPRVLLPRPPIHSDSPTSFQQHLQISIEKD